MIVDILTAMSTLIAEQNDSIIYLNNQEEGFDRPSFFINYISGSTQDLNMHVMDNNIFIQIVYFAPCDSYNNPDKIDQLNTHDMLKETFKKGYFQVGDRVVKIQQMLGGPKDAEVYLTLELTLTENKQPLPEVLPTVEEFNLELQGGIDNGNRTT